MMVKILIQRKVKQGKEDEFKKLVRELFTGAIHSKGFISGETMKAIGNPAVHMTIGTWRSLKHLDNWLNSPARKQLQDKLDEILAEPAKMTAFHYE